MIQTVVQLILNRNNFNTLMSILYLFGYACLSHMFGSLSVVIASIIRTHLNAL